MLQRMNNTRTTALKLPNSDTQIHLPRWHPVLHLRILFCVSLSCFKLLLVYSNGASTLSRMKKISLDNFLNTFLIFLFILHKI